MATVDYEASRDLSERALASGRLGLEDVIRGYRVLAVSRAQLEDAKAEQAFLRLFALEPDSQIAMRLSPNRRSAVLNARGFWSVHKGQFGLEVSYDRRERQVVVKLRDALRWTRRIQVWARYGEHAYVKMSGPAQPESIFTIQGAERGDTVEVYVSVSDERDNVVMEFGREREPHVFALSPDEAYALQRRDIRGGQPGSYARRLAELGVPVGVHGYLSLEFKPVDDVPSFDLHHATLMIRADLLRQVSVEMAFEWEHLGLDEDDGFYLPHAFIDLKASELLVLRAGFFEATIGAFNEYLYPDFLRITGLPPLFSESVVPALWSEVGIQVRGRARLTRSSALTYAAFVSNGLEQRDPVPDDGIVEEGGDIREMRFNARDEHHADKAVGGRVGLEAGGFDLGFSGYTGRYTIERNRRLNILDSDLSFVTEWLTLRAEGALALQQVTGDRLEKYGLYALAAVRPIPYLEPYAQYDLLELDGRLQRGLVGIALYPFPLQRMTRSLRLKSEAGYEFPEDAKREFVWFMQLTTGF